LNNDEPFGSIYFLDILHIGFGCTFYGNFGIFPRFGLLHQEKSGNPGHQPNKGLA
jgi:hypothetical protein